MKISDIQNIILEQTGIKTSVKKLTGSMKNYICFSPMFQNGCYPEFAFEWRQEFIKQFQTIPGNPNFASGTTIEILKINFDEGESIKYSKESKPKIAESVKTWGSKNSQIRLDKAVRRYAKRARNGNTVRYY